MKLAAIGEMGLIKLLARGAIVDPRGVKVGIGDDTAVLDAGGGNYLLATTDMLIEGEHFLPTTTTPPALGHKALAVNLSDIAAMGGVARHALVAIGIPSHREVEEIEEIYRGMKELARRHGVNIVGGDTVHSPQGLVINVTLLGEVEEENLSLRSGAKVGDKILVTGELGGSHAGLQVLLKKVDRSLLPEELLQQAIRRHYYPCPRLEEGRALVVAGGVGALNDISDGLAKDLAEIAESSQVGAELWPDQIPVAPATAAIAEALNQAPLSFALYGGEDFELVMTVEPGAEERLLREAAKVGFPLRVIGEIKPAAAGLYLKGEDGQVQGLAPGGWDHFQEQGEGE